MHRHAHILCQQQSLFFQKFCLVSDQPGLGPAGWVLTALQGGVEMSQGPCSEGHGPRPLSSGPYTKKGPGFSSWGLPLFAQWLASGLLLRVLLGANDTWVQAHLRGTRTGATPLTFKQLPPRSRRLPCRKRERGIREFSWVIMNTGTNLCVQQ